MYDVEADEEAYRGDIGVGGVRRDEAAGAVGEEDDVVELEGARLEGADGGAGAEGVAVLDALIAVLKGVDESVAAHRAAHRGKRENPQRAKEQLDLVHTFAPRKSG